MIDTIGTGRLRARVDSMGAQLTSLSLDGREYLWQGDARWWSGQAPVLFPIVGTIRDGRARSAAGPVELGRHGLARRLEHARLGATDDAVRYELRSDDSTRAAFPYDFALRMTYSVVGETTLEQRFEVENTGRVPLPFTLGAHPAFNVPAEGTDEAFEDYELRFGRAWTYASPSLDHATGLLDFRHRWEVLREADALPLTHDPFREHDTIVFEGVPGGVVTLVGRRSGRGVRVAFEGFDYLGVWSEMHDAPFVAVEPWTGCATAADEDDVLEHKRGMRLLAVGETDSRAFTVELL